MTLQHIGTIDSVWFEGVHIFRDSVVISNNSLVLWDTAGAGYSRVGHWAQGHSDSRHCWLQPGPST